MFLKELDILSAGSKVIFQRDLRWRNNVDMYITDVLHCETFRLIWTENVIKINIWCTVHLEKIIN
jgi:hypothetical protein